MISTSALSRRLDVSFDTKNPSWRCLPVVADLHTADRAIRPIGLLSVDSREMGKSNGRNGRSGRTKSKLKQRAGTRYRSLILAPAPTCVDPAIEAGPAINRYGRRRSRRRGLFLLAVAAKAGAPINAMAAIAVASLFMASVELIVQPDAHDVVGCFIASPEAIVQAKPNHVEAVVEGCVERRGACWRAAAAEGGDGANGNSCESHCFGAQIDKLIFDLRTPMLVKQPFRAAASSPTKPGLCRSPRKTQSDASCCPSWSRTTKQASCSLTDHGGGKRRAAIGFESAVSHSARPWTAICQRGGAMDERGRLS
jgi:hypothetical protein